MIDDAYRRPDGRRADMLRPIAFQRNFTRYAEGSVLVSFGETRVLCNATVEDKVPPFMPGGGARLDHGRICHVAQSHPLPQSPGVDPG